MKSLDAERASGTPSNQWPNPRFIFLAVRTDLRVAKDARFTIHLNYLWLPSVDLAVRRVRQRVRKGGHAVPESDIRRRYARSIGHLGSHYLPLADAWWIWDNEENPPHLLASHETHGIEQVSSLLQTR